MADIFEEHLQVLDGKPSLNTFFVAYGVIRREHNVVPGAPVPIKPLPRRRLAVILATMDLTLGNALKGRGGVPDPFNVECRNLKVKLESVRVSLQS